MTRKWLRNALPPSTRLLTLSDPSIVQDDSDSEPEPIEMPTIYCPQVEEDIFCLGDHPATCIDAIFPVFPTCGCRFPTNAHCVICWAKSLEKTAEGEPPKCWKCGKPHESACGVLRTNGSCYAHD